MKDRKALHRALDCVLDRRAAKDAAEWNPETKSYSDPSKCPVCSGKGFTMGKKVSKYAGQPPISKCIPCKGTGKIAAKDAADFPAEYKNCKRCGKKTDVLEIFPGGVCLGCWEKKEGKAPLTESDFKGMVNTFKYPLKRGKDSDERTADIWSSYSHKERRWALQDLGLPESLKTRLYRDLPADAQKALQKLWATGQKRG